MITVQLFNIDDHLTTYTEREELESKIFTWLETHIDCSDYDFLSYHKTVMSDSDFEYLFVDSIVFKNEEDAMAFKLRFGS